MITRRKLAVTTWLLDSVRLSVEMEGNTRQKALDILRLDEDATPGKITLSVLGSTLVNSGKSLYFHLVPPYGAGRFACLHAVARIA